ncbi:MAG: hypothetical protein JNN18_11295 [Rubrivivax sp.]|nr:hypothetical protein [Rubrivivax sp.]
MKGADGLPAIGSSASRACPGRSSSIATCTMRKSPAAVRPPGDDDVLDPRSESDVLLTVLDALSDAADDAVLEARAEAGPSASARARRRQDDAFMVGRLGSSARA